MWRYHLCTTSAVATNKRLQTQWLSVQHLSSVLKQLRETNKQERKVPMVLDSIYLLPTPNNDYNWQLPVGSREDSITKPQPTCTLCSIPRTTLDPKWIRNFSTAGLRFWKNLHHWKYKFLTGTWSSQWSFPWIQYGTGKHVWEDLSIPDKTSDQDIRSSCHYSESTGNRYRTNLFNHWKA